MPGGGISVVINLMQFKAGRSVNIIGT